MAWLGRPARRARVLATGLDRRAHARGLAGARGRLVGASGVVYAPPVPHRRLQGVIDDTIADLSNMPILVRPMVKAGLRKRTGMSLGEWQDIARELATAPDAAARGRVVAQQPGLLAALERRVPGSS
jgi:hypothetical protein